MHMMIIAIHSSPLILRCGSKHWKPFLLKRAWLILRPWMKSLTPTRTKSAHKTGPKLLQRHGWTQIFAQPCSRMPHRPCAILGFMDVKANIWSRWKIPQPRTTWSSAHYAVVIHGHCWAFRQVGTNLMPIAPVRCVNPARYCRNLEQQCARFPRLLLALLQWWRFLHILGICGMLSSLPRCQWVHALACI